MEAVNEQTLKELRALPASQCCKLIDFDKAEVRPGFIPNTFFLIVTGNAPYFRMDVQLVPLVYVKRPEYWEIEVVGCLPGPFALREFKPFTETLPLDAITGEKGIEVVGATKRVRIDLAYAKI
jgi:hypothetical protein